jgi:hypothetical protein
MHVHLSLLFARGAVSFAPAGGIKPFQRRKIVGLNAIFAGQATIKDDAGQLNTICYDDKSGHNRRSNLRPGGGMAETRGQV